MKRSIYTYFCLANPINKDLTLEVAAQVAIQNTTTHNITTFRHSKLRYSNHFPSRGSPLRAREQTIKAASLSRIEAGSRAGAGNECGGGVPAGGGVRPGYGYEALSAASDGSDQELDEAPEYAPFEMELSGGGESVEGPSSRGSAKVNFPPDVELERRPTGTFAGAAAAAFHRGRGRSMSAWSDISRSSIRFEER
ncbi:unnamed protein product [Euphydryas editha]|uniref:Uncharacterized protein n=1 Tax=Euphydryas editha TaxID=104508 RepID=A0AAU9UVW4_EUPED|nr:unnamed protein product [Euphydryas editha]